MIILNYKSNLEQKEIFNKFNKYEEFDVPSAFDPLAMYYDPRIGLHIRSEHGMIKGYYEDGQFETRGNLMRGKNFFWLFVREKDKYTSIKGVIVFAPFFVIMLFLSNLMALFCVENAIAYIIVELILLFFIVGDKIYKEQPEIRDLIIKMTEK